ncbi:hypothetical protein PIB30_004249 [Stylosanthes scabra]|uniref:BHLH domain-containing protein n=1 Tax=Stylosanthes scabra TaxID=79078 RepID=A0ABU6S3F5_9FABA|nr:hypothetical protein [Stylosanthes scabra]
MELYYDDNDHDFLEELMALRRETLETNNNNNHHFFSNNGGSNTWNNNNSSNTFDCYYYDQNSLSSFPPNSSSSYHEDLLLPHDDQIYNNHNMFNEIIYDDSLLLDEQSPPLIMDHHHSSYASSNLDTPPFLAQEDCCYPPLSLMEEEEYNNYNNGYNGLLLEEELQNLLEIQTTTPTTKCKVEPSVIACDDSSQSPTAPIFNADSVMGNEIRKNRSSKKILGQPSKNLMAERRRRKRLNDRLSMLRAIVPKISKMDRTSILGDTIDYMKELLEKINNLQQQEVVKVEDSNMAEAIFKDVKRPNEILIRNSPKFEVERGVDNNTRVEICCAGKPGLLLSTINTMEALGLEIQQCVISCFNDFTMQVSCTEEVEQRAMVSSEDIKQALFRSAGYGGRCL